MPAVAVAAMTGTHAQVLSAAEFTMAMGTVTVGGHA